VADVKLDLSAVQSPFGSFWYVRLSLAGTGIWSSDAFQARDEIHALGVGVEIFARQFGEALRGDESEYEGG